MQVNKFFYGLFVCAAFCACSNDETAIIPDDNPKVFTGDEAYISVRLSDASSLTRATTTDPGYEYGTTDEHTVKNAYFYFYDAEGVFVCEGSAWNGGTASENTSPNGNIEFKSNTVVVLKGLSEKNYPKYMVTVLNRPDGLSASGSVPQSLDDMVKKLASGTGDGITTTIDQTKYFVMSTTSFKHDDADGLSGKYFVTEVKDENFSLAPIPDPEKIPNPVTVYVERLAAKVTLKIDGSLTPVTIRGKTGNYYKVKATVAGEGNDDDANASGNQIAAEDLYVRLLGWKLNATAKYSNIVKNIDESWSNEASGALGFVWNKPTDFRSFWGKSFNYDNSSYSSYPTTAKGYSSSNESCPLNYFNLNDNLSELGTTGVAYCAENTNTSAIVSANFPSAVTSILLKAEVCDATGNALDLVRFNGVLFKQASFIEYILNVMKAKGQWNVYKKTNDNPETYQQLAASDVELTNAYDGKVKVQLKSDVKSGDLYSESNGAYSPITDKDSFDTNLSTECTNGNAIGYKGGLMYYNIPIEHLNNTANTEDEGKTIIPEAKYGVVRNHHYQVTINKLENIGHGIFDPNEVIVPGDSDDDKKAYYVGANINILSWKIVSQGVDL